MKKIQTCLRRLEWRIFVADYDLESGMMLLDLALIERGLFREKLVRLYHFESRDMPHLWQQIQDTRKEHERRNS